MRIDGGRLGWGVFFITLGLVPLAVRFGWIDASWFEGIWRLWPFVLIGIGVGLILRRTAFGAVGNVIVGLTFGLMIGGALATPINAGISCLPGSAAASGETSNLGTFDAGHAEVDIAVPCAEVIVGSVPGTGWAVSSTGLDPDDLKVESDATRLEVDRAGGSGVWGQGEQARVQVELPTDPELDLSLDVSAGSATTFFPGAHLRDLSVSVNAGDATANLSEATLDTFSISVNAGSATLDLPASPWHGTASINAGSLEVCVPAGTAMRVTGSSTLGSIEPGAGFSSTAGGWATSAWSSAGSGAELSVSVNLGSVSVREGGCQ